MLIEASDLCVEYVMAEAARRGQKIQIHIPHGTITSQIDLCEQPKYTKYLELLASAQKC